MTTQPNQSLINTGTSQHELIAPGMTVKRWVILNRGDESLAPEEINSGWHFCPDWDQMLICKGMPESDACTCNLANNHVA